MDVMDLINEGKIKRYFRARKKLNAPNIVCHITQRAAGKEPLFLEDDDYLQMLVLFKRVAKNLSVFEVCFQVQPQIREKGPSFWRPVPPGRLSR